MSNKVTIRKDSRIRSRMGEIRRNGLVFNAFGLLPILWGVILVGVILWGISVALADPLWYLDNANSFLVKDFTLSNFAEAIQKFKVEVNDAATGVRWVGYWELVFNTIWYSLGATAMKMIATVCFAYAVARFEFPGRKLLYGFVVLQMMLPVYGQTAANYNLLSRLGLVDNFGFLLSQGAGHGMYFLITYSFFRNLPTGYMEAAKMDGAGPFTIFGRVMLPLAKPITVALTIMQIIAHWNAYGDILIYLPSYPTLASALYYLRSNMFYLGLQTPAYFAGILISVLPVVVLFVVFNKQIMENVSIGGLKG